MPVAHDPFRGYPSTRNWPGAKVDVEEQTVDEILNAVADDKRAARRALTAENKTGSPRKTLVEGLERILAS